jgi:hypothetical protein
MAGGANKSSDVHLLGKLERIVYLYSQIPDGAF